eukprot:CAMPEP_0202037916 /NCGR_PEP_ID=MMETSP0962-20130828/2456_1 /ASSEMBLY_ACC=CAM_ASM_000488 /TAXON_ID=4773 /ORGANISM="Schizochytrium aggregatum, Strain ATCC28209" /LENGTH=231 /DNA_ID=CAMNT_0048602045 /DNA_START=161 /DNA_END=858 /DNA_ORIENTATION=-
MELIAIELVAKLAWPEGAIGSQGRRDGRTTGVRVLGLVREAPQIGALALPALAGRGRRAAMLAASSIALLPELATRVAAQALGAGVLVAHTSYLARLGAAKDAAAMSLAAQPVVAGRVQLGAMQHGKGSATVGSLMSLLIVSHNRPTVPHRTAPHRTGFIRGLPQLLQPHSRKRANQSDGYLRIWRGAEVAEVASEQEPQASSSERDLLSRVSGKVGRSVGRSAGPVRTLD